jgi:hypothetical protein
VRFVISCPTPFTAVPGAIKPDKPAYQLPVSGISGFVFRFNRHSFRCLRSSRACLLIGFPFLCPTINNVAFTLLIARASATVHAADLTVSAVWAIGRKKADPVFFIAFRFYFHFSAS